MIQDRREFKHLYRSERFFLKIQGVFFFRIIICNGMLYIDVINGRIFYSFNKIGFTLGNKRYHRVEHGIFRHLFELFFFYDKILDAYIRIIKEFKAKLFIIFKLPIRLDFCNMRLPLLIERIRKQRIQQEFDDRFSKRIIPVRRTCQKQLIARSL